MVVDVARTGTSETTIECVEVAVKASVEVVIGADEVGLTVEEIAWVGVVVGVDETDVV